MKVIQIGFFLVLASGHFVGTHLQDATPLEDKLAITENLSIHLLHDFIRHEDHSVTLQQPSLEITLYFQKPETETDNTEKVIQQVKQEIENRKVFYELVKLFDVLAK